MTCAAFLEIVDRLQTSTPSEQIAALDHHAGCPDCQRLCEEAYDRGSAAEQEAEISAALRLVERIIESRQTDRELPGFRA
jgi:hypothetical protein